MRLDPLYRLSFRYEEAWHAELGGERGTESEHFLIAEGRSEGRLTGRFRAVNHAHRRTDLVYVPDLQGVIETDDGATVMLDYRGYGMIEGDEQRVVGFARHVSADERYTWLNTTVAAISGEVRRTGETERPTIVLDLAELVWEPPRYDEAHEH